MKRTLTLIRHAKSSWKNPGFRDFDRPLNKRGIRDAPRVGEALQQEGISFGKVLRSDAQRARQTLALLGQNMQLEGALIEYRHDMYCASADHLYFCLADVEDNISSIALIGHNPGMEDLANRLAGEHVGPMPTCCVIHFAYECDSWSVLRPGQGKIITILKPREL